MCAFTKWKQSMSTEVPGSTIFTLTHIQKHFLTKRLFSGSPSVKGLHVYTALTATT